MTTGGPDWRPRLFACAIAVLATNGFIVCMHLITGTGPFWDRLASAPEGFVNISPLTALMVLAIVMPTHEILRRKGFNDARANIFGTGVVLSIFIFTGLTVFYMLRPGDPLFLMDDSVTPKPTKAVMQSFVTASLASFVIGALAGISYRLALLRWLKQG